MGWVKKKLYVPLPTLLNGVSTQCVETIFKRVGGGVTYLLRGVCVEMGGGECGDGVGVGGGYVYGVGEEKVIDNFAYSFAWSLYIMCRDPLQKDRGRGGVFIEGCVCVEMEGGGGSVVMVLVVDMYMGWVKKKL